jgi:hypothetical protein
MMVPVILPAVRVKDLMSTSDIMAIAGSKCGSHGAQSQRRTASTRPERRLVASERPAAKESLTFAGNKNLA